MPGQAGFIRRLGRGSGSGAGRGILRFWLLWESLANWLWPSVPIPGATVNALRIRLTRYCGHPFTLPDGTPIASGDSIAEIHFDNARVAQITHQRPWALPPALTSDLASLALAIERGEVPHVKGLTAVTILVSGGKLMGFSPREQPPDWRSWFERLYFNGLLAVYTPDGTQRLRRGSTVDTYPKELWMSSRELDRRYGSRSPGRSEKNRG
jgi:hypothetical protein